MTKRVWALTLLVGLYGCGGDTGPVDSGSDGEVTNPDGGGGRDDAGPACERDSDCDDGLFCNGAETCVAGGCMPGTAPDCDDAVMCTTDICDETTDVCRNLPDDSACTSPLVCTPSGCGP